MTTPFANLCLQLVYLQCCKSIVLPFFLWGNGASSQVVWWESVVFAEFLFHCILSHIAVYCVSACFLLSLSLSLSCTHNACAHRVPPSQLTLPQRHLSLGKARWWMQVGGWYACAHFCVRLGVRMNGIERESGERGRARAVRTVLYVCFC